MGSFALSAAARYQFSKHVMEGKKPVEEGNDAVGGKEASEEGNDAVEGAKEAQELGRWLKYMDIFGEEAGSGTAMAPFGMEREIAYFRGALS